jgi:hypothetical protein
MTNIIFILTDYFSPYTVGSGAPNLQKLSAETLFDNLRAKNG